MDEQRYSDVQIQTLEPQHVACYRVVSPTPEDDVHRFMKDWLVRQNLGRPVREFGFDVDVNPDQQKAGLRGYEVWKVVPASVQPSDGVTIRDFEGGLYAMMTIYKPFSDPFKWIPYGWKSLHQWVIESDRYRGAGHQWLEELIGEDHQADLALYHPVMPAEQPEASLPAA